MKRVAEMIRVSGQSFSDSPHDTDQISSKAASITYVELIDLLLLVSDDVPYRDLMVHALHRAYMGLSPSICRY